MAGKRLLSLPVASTWDGRAPLESHDFCGLWKIGVNRSEWQEPSQLGALLIPDGGTLIIRREGKMIYIERGE